MNRSRTRSIQYVSAGESTDAPRSKGRAHGPRVHPGGAEDTRLLFEACDCIDWTQALWHLPGSGAIARLLEYACFGPPPERWSSQVAVGPVDEAVIVEAFLTAVSAGSDVAAVMASAWREARLLAIERRTPFVTGSGKVLHLQVPR